MVATRNLIIETVRGSTRDTVLLTETETEIEIMIVVETGEIMIEIVTVKRNPAREISSLQRKFNRKVRRLKTASTSTSVTRLCWITQTTLKIVNKR